MATARSTRFGSAVTGLLFAVGLGTAALSIGAAQLTLAMLAAGVLVGVAVALRRTTSPAAQAAAAILVPVAAIAETVGLGFVLARSFEPSVLAGASLPVALLLALAMFAVPLSIGVGAMVGGLGLIASLRTKVDGGGVAQVIGTSLFTMAVLAAVFAASLAIRMAVGEAVLNEWAAIGDEIVTVAADTIGPADPKTGLLMFFVLLTAAGFIGFQAIRIAPLSELAPSDYRSHVERAAIGARRLTAWAAVIGLFGAIILVTTAESGTLEAAVNSDGVVRSVVIAMGSDGLQWLLVLLTGVFAAIWVSIALLQWLTGGVSSVLQRIVPASAGAVVVIGFAAVESPSVIADLQTAASRAPEPFATILEVASTADLVLLLAGLALAVLIFTLIAFIAISVMGLVPNRSMGGVLVGAGLGLGAIAMALAGGSPIMVYVVLGLGILSWDVSDRSSRAVADLARGRGPSLPVELLHWLASAGVALVGILAAVALLRVVQGARPLPVNEYTLAALAAVAAAVILLIGISRG